ncbi:MAG: pseudouridylate synthase [Prolixibacteraceae bacterium]|nr:pseudouridylate synthase [Prolixibacteraceae bacterium]
MQLEIIFRDEHLVAINKPHGLLVHKSRLAADADEFAVQLLRNQLGVRVTPVHRLDRKTGGVLLFALNDESNKVLNLQFDQNRVHKKYLAMVRGYTPDEERVDYDLRKENGQLQRAVTNFRTLERVEVPVAFGMHETQRYSLVEVQPETGRMHQIRKHFNHLRHPIIGDRPHGCNKQNRLFKERWNMSTMLLHATEMEFEHPAQLSMVKLSANLQPEFVRTLQLLGFQSFRTEKLKD